MESTISFNVFNEVNGLSYYERGIPMISVIDLVNEKTGLVQVNQLGLYGVLISPTHNEEGILSFIMPGQNIDAANCNTYPRKLIGRALIFHPDLIKGTSLTKCMSAYGLFGYSSNRSLSLSPREYQFVLNCFSNITGELKHVLDGHSKRLITSNIELCLNYCELFYIRKYSVPENIPRDIEYRLDECLSHYFSSEKASKLGFPTVSYCAGELNLSANYFGSLVKKETGRTAYEYIREKIVEEAKYRIVHVHKTINEIADELGFKYPQHFSRLFKKVVGRSPKEYRMVNRSLFFF